MKILLFWKILLFYDTTSLAGSEQALFTPKCLFLCVEGEYIITLFFHPN